MTKMKNEKHRVVKISYPYRNSSVGHLFNRTISSGMCEAVTHKPKHGLRSKAADVNLGANIVVSSA